jgi:hypothetical protein
MLSLLGVINALVAVAFILAGRPDIRKALVAYLNRTLAEMTFKKAIFFAAAVIVAVMVFEVLPFEMALPLFLDAFTYIDIVAAVYLALANRHARAWGRIARNQLVIAGGSLVGGLQKRRPLSACARRLRQVRARPTVKGSEDDDGGWAKAWSLAV